MESLFTPPNVANLCNNIKPGDLIHEDVRQSFSEYFGRFNRRQKVYIRQDDHSVIQQLPCFVLKVWSTELLSKSIILSTYCRYHLMNAKHI